MSSNKKHSEKHFKYKSRIEKKLYPALKNTIKGDVYGYIDEKGNLIIEPKFTRAYDFNKYGLAIVEENDKWGLINVKGEYVIKPIYDNINEFNEMRAIFNIKDYMGVLNEKGTVITKKKYNFISDYKDGRAVIAVSSDNGEYIYGYIDLYGKEIVSPKYSEANDFNNGVALVKSQEKSYSLINRSGQVLATYNYEYVAQYGDGLIVFANSYDGPFGFMDINGKEVIKPIYKQAQGFKNKVAIVTEDDSYVGPYGVIDLNGRYIFQPIFSDVKILGEDRLALGMSIGEDKYLTRYIYAIGDTKGNKLTDFIYLVVGDYKDGLAYASDNENTFFIDKLGNEVKSLPIVSGSGELSIKNDLVYANIDYSPYYLDKSGKVIYKPNNVINLNKNYSVMKNRYKPNINYLIYNPVINGVKNRSIQDEINIKLKEMSYFKPYGEDGKPKDAVISKDDVLTYDYYGNFSVKYFKKNLLILDLMGYYYPIGAAHGMPTIKTPSIDLVTGKFYTIGDLFMGGVNWLGELNKIIQKMINSDPQYEYVNKNAFKSIRIDQDFYIDGDNLYIYFPPYEIGPYAAGFITFKIPFSEISGMINKNGAFYLSFN
ncbi:DUF3298 domain-containing protein [Clostridium botulinum]|uniref:WG repeat-containing protein n=1 Tax=unclassified Clostridium TaxID=2614128 RepID=UPI000506A4D0|nr:hypothetical protein KU40_07870 [Clostridium botulinum]MBY6777897.1 WG repeat-containing protein [Clostridium botulinum]MBY6851115.1 WG repeat-containing protein [Clostridium botulinum]MBY7008878.1 WG repeat-containing protein [Clostridium botulinum]NFF24831.1 DUF3298 domain-containing protein [Clostridium botulinum]